MDLDEAFKVVGEFGPYQKRAVAVLVLTQVSVFKNVFFYMMNANPESVPTVPLWRSGALALRGSVCLRRRDLLKFYFEPTN